MRYVMKRAVLLCCVLLAACDNTDTSEQALDAGVDAGVDASVTSQLAPAPTGGGFCCPVDTTPNCNAFRSDGWTPVDDPARCNLVADMAPPFESSFDEHGCEVITSKNSCLANP